MMTTTQITSTIRQQGSFQFGGSTRPMRVTADAVVVEAAAQGMPLVMEHTAAGILLSIDYEAAISQAACSCFGCSSVVGFTHEAR